MPTYFLHVEVGGRCEYCWEDWPCTYVRLGPQGEAKAEGMSLQEWQRQGEETARAARDQEWANTVEPIIKAAKDLGLKEIADELDFALLRNHRSHSIKSLPITIGVSTEELVWVLKAAADAGLRWPKAPPVEEPLPFARPNSEGVY